MKNPTIAVFDVGNVLIEWDPRHLYRQLFTDPARMEWFLAEVCTNEWNVEQDRGRPFADAVAERIAKFPDLAAEIRAYDERWPETVPGEIKDTVVLLEALRANGTRTFAITNFSCGEIPLAQKRFGFLNGFEGVVVSGEEKVLKPDPAIYRTLLDRYGLRGRRLSLHRRLAEERGRRAGGRNARPPLHRPGLPGRRAEAAGIPGQLVAGLSLLLSFSS